MRSFLTARGSNVVTALVLVATAASAAPPPPDVHALDRATFYFRARDGTVLTLLMVQLLAHRVSLVGTHGAKDPRYLGVASVEETGRHGEDLPGSEHRAVPLVVAPDTAKDETATFYGRVYLQSGRSYLVRYLVKDAAREEIFMKNSLLSVPYLTGGFSASSV